MEYSIYKLEFQTGVHFGTGMLNESAYTFCADQLFSALYIEALKMDCAKEFYEKVKSGALLFSDAFPYMGQTYMIPKPMIYVETKEQGISEQKKLYKKMKFISVDNLDGFLKGTLEITENPMRNYGDFFQKKSAKVRNEGETEPYQVGIYYCILSWLIKGKKKNGWQKICWNLCLIPELEGKRQQDLENLFLKVRKCQRCCMHI